MRRFLVTGTDETLNRRVEMTALRRDGHEFPAEVAIAPIRMADHWIFSVFVRGDAFL